MEQRLNDALPHESRLSCSVSPVTPADLRVIMCFRFDPRARPGEIAAFKAALIGCPLIVHSLELSGTYDFIVEAALPDMSSYQDHMRNLAEPLTRLVARHDTNFICKRFVRRREAERSIWVPCKHGLQRVDASLVDKIIAEGDYMRIYSRGTSWMVHSTMTSLLKRLSDCNLIRVHRSACVRAGFIERIMHSGRQWSARLNDGSTVRIAESHVGETMEVLNPSSSTRDQRSSKLAAFDENLAVVNEN